MAQELDSSIAPVVRLPPEGSGPETVGTAFCIGYAEEALAVFLTASHVIRQYEGTDVNLGVMLAPAPSATQDRVFAPMRGVGIRDDHNDICAFTVELGWTPFSMPTIELVSTEDPTVTIPLAPPALLSPLPPEPMNSVRLRRLEIGEPCTATGYGDPHPGEPAGFVSRPLISIEGTVAEVHDHRRDASFVPYPSVMVNTNEAFPHVMSGGPVYDLTGRIFGVVSTGWKVAASPFGYAAHIAASGQLPVTRRDGSEFGAAILFEDLDIGPGDVFIDYNVAGEGGIRVRWAHD